MFSLGDNVLGEPVETLIQAVTSGGAGSLDVPGSASECVQAELVSDFGSGQGAWEILLVGEDEEDGIAELLFREHLVELFAGIIDSVAIVGVNDEDEALSVLVVVSPEKSNLVLTADVPHSERDVLVLDSLDVKADSGDSGDDLTKLELVEDSGLTGGIEADHEDAHLLLADEARPDLGEH